MKVFKLAFWFILLLAVFLIFVTLAGQNQDAIDVTLFNYTTPDYQKWVVITASFFIGSAFSALFFIGYLVVLETKYIRLKRAHKKLERVVGAQQESAPTRPAALTVTNEPAALPPKGVDTEDV